MEVGKTRKLKATVTPDSASDKEVKWSSSNKKIVTVNQNGKVKGVKEGTARIKVKAKDGSGKKAVCIVKVTDTSSNSESSSAGGSSRSSGASSSGSAGAGTTGSTSGGSAATTAAGGASTASAQAAGTGQNTAQQTADGSTESGGWSFDGAAYVPESSASADSGDNTSGTAEGNGADGSAGKGTITIEIPVEVAYTLSGAAGLGALEGLLWLLKKKGVLGLLLGVLRRR